MTSSMNGNIDKIRWILFKHKNVNGYNPFILYFILTVTFFYYILKKIIMYVYIYKFLLLLLLLQSSHIYTVFCMGTKIT